MGLLPHAQTCGLRMRRECWERFHPTLQVSDPDMHHGACVTHVPWWMTESLTSGFLWSRWRGKRSRHSRRMRNQQFCVSGKRPMKTFPFKLISTSTIVIWAFQLHGHYKSVGVFWKIHKQYVLIGYVNHPYVNACDMMVLPRSMP